MARVNARGKCIYVHNLGEGSLVRGPRPDPQREEGVRAAIAKARKLVAALLREVMADLPETR